MTTHAHDESRSEDASDSSQDNFESLMSVTCNADGLPYELSTHYLMYGPAIPDEVTQAAARHYSRDAFRRNIIFYLDGVV